jgi:hypothetical protein
VKHKRKKRQLVQKDYTKTCAWCLRRIPEEHERFGFGAKAAPNVDLSRVEGTMIEIQLVSVGKTVPVGVTGPDSQTAFWSQPRRSLEKRLEKSLLW